jgi:hypothetical protein
VCQDDPLAAHVLAVGAFDLVRQYAACKRIELRSNFLSRLPPDLAKEAVNGLKLIYNFVRHSDRDPDKSVDTSTLTPFTDIFIALAAQLYREAFGSETKHMELFRAFTYIRHPRMISAEAREGFANLPAVRAMAALSRDEQLESLNQLFEQRCQDERDF